MNVKRHHSIALAGALTVIAIAGSATLAQPGGDDEPGTAALTLAVWDHPGRQAEQAALDLVALAPELSDGSIVVSEPMWGAANAADLVTSGQVDLAILAAREWSPLGVTSLDVLEAPFLIDNDALALEVATSDVAAEAMTGLEALGVTGLAMWPEDHRHAFAFAPSGRTFRSAEDFAGATVLAIAATPGQDLIATLGAELYADGVEVGPLTGDRVLDAQSGELDGMVTGLWGAGLPPDIPATVAGDVVLYPKYQMLVASSRSLAELNEVQRAAFDQIVARVHQGALGRHFTEDELAQGFCASGGTVVEAGESAIAELRTAAQPVTDALASDPLAGRLIDRVREIANATPRSPAAAPCEPAHVALDGAANAEAVSSVPVAAGHTGIELIPDGTYRAEMVADQLRAAGAGAFYASVNQGIWTLSIDGDRWEASHASERCSGSHEVIDGAVRLTTVASQGCGMDYDVAWRLDGDALSLMLVDLAWSDEPAMFAEERTFIDRIWTRIEAPAP